MTKVKICGITNLDDARLAVETGADMLGFNFYEKSVRCIPPVKAREMIERLPDGVLKVGVFVNETADRIAEIVNFAGLDAVQLHGEESPDFVQELKLLADSRVIKAFRVSKDFIIESVLSYDVDEILLDGFSANAQGGTGETFDWDVAEQISSSVSLYLAGGLSADNVRAAISKVRPYAVDACSLLESNPGKKDHDKLRRFILEAKRND
jgi:phosphoribosylanthranilate isomerase